MPVYDYKCREHGIFHDLGAMAQAGQPKPCPQCRQLSAQVILIPPALLDMAPSARKAIARNEEAAHVPKIYTPESHQDADERKPSRCGCSSDHKPLSKTASLSQKALLTADGNKIFPSQRPWMISH